jgi:hypothetical protein
VTVVTDPKTNILKLVERCRSCGAQIYWSTTDKGKLCPYDVVNGKPTRESHFAGAADGSRPGCPQARRWSKKA